MLQHAFFSALKKHAVWNVVIYPDVEPSETGFTAVNRRDMPCVISALCQVIIQYCCSYYSLVCLLHVV